MGKFLVRIFTTLFIILLVISTTALGVLFVIRNNDLNNSQNEVTKLKEDLSEANNKILDLEAAAGSSSSKLEFLDTGMGVTVEYPASWTPVAKSKLELVADTTTTTLKEYELKFSKGTSSITFSRLFEPAGDLAVGYPSSEYDVQAVGTKLIRVADKGSDNWSYKSKVDCADAIEVPAGAENCGSGSFFPGFGTATGSAGFASAIVKDASLLSEIDAIVLSAVN